MILVRACKRAVMLLIASGAALASPAIAASEPSARLVTCGNESCLLVSGRRDDEASSVRINGHAVPVDGKRRWRVSLPLETVRDWSAPFARTIEVTVLEADTGREAFQRANLPIGLLGHATELASLVVRAR